MQRRRVVAAVAAGTALLCVPSTAFAKQPTVGVPGEPNCHGQTVAYVTQGGQTPFVEARGIGNVAKANNAHVKGVMFQVDLFCGN